MSTYQNKSYRYRHHALYGDRVLGALSTSDYRTYVYPFFTPKGVDVIQECPPDHLHHQGIMFGQDLVNGHNFWASLHPGYPINRQIRHSQVECEPTGDHITYRVHLAWRTTGDQHVVDERRVVRFAAWEEANVVDVSATYIASYGDVFFGQTKEGGLGMRVHPMLEAEMGGRVIASTGVEGAENIFDTYADWIAVCGNVGPNEVGIMMMPHPSMERIPWFTRGYGLHMYGPFRHRAARLEAGDTFELRVGFAAFDGPWDPGRARAIWERYASEAK